MSYGWKPAEIEEVKVTFYDLLRGLVDRTPWRDELERNRYMELLKKLEEVNLFGYLSQQVHVTKVERK